MLEHTGGDRPEHIFLAFELKSVSGVRSALESGYHVVVGSEHVNYLAFAFVAPLEAEQYVNFHFDSVLVYCSVIVSFFCGCGGYHAAHMPWIYRRKYEEWNAE